MSLEDPRPRTTATGAPLPQRIRLSASGGWAELAADDLTESGIVLSTGPDPAQLAEQSHVEREDPSWLLHDYTHRMSSVLWTVSDRLWSGGPARGERVGSGAVSGRAGAGPGDEADRANSSEGCAGPASALHVGAGALTMPRWIEQHWPRTAQTVLDIEPELVDFVLEHLPMRARPENIIADAAEVFRDGGDSQGEGGVASERTAAVPPSNIGVEQGGGETGRPTPGVLVRCRFDVVITDLFNSAAAPAALTSAEFYASTLRALRPGGLLLMNLGDDAGMAFARAQLEKLLALLPDSSHALLTAPEAVLAGAEEGNLVFALTPSAPFSEPELERIWAAGPHPGDVLTGAELNTWSLAGR